ncbi:hypothetical protein H2203_003822 [Taxawa tesnikishii (nom. ined.)]|nr:hypothetical protein H2203_003822 [Dothideales sp. JES 119]
MSDNICTFLDLPLELRLQIYHYLFRDSIVTIKLGDKSIATDTFDDTAVLIERSGSGSVLCTSRSIYQEATPVFWVKTTFHFEYIPAVDDGVVFQLETLERLGVWDKINQVSFKLSVRDCLFSKGERFPFNGDALADLLMLCPNLRLLRLCIFKDQDIKFRWGKSQRFGDPQVDDMRFSVPSPNVPFFARMAEQTSWTHHRWRPWADLQHMMPSEMPIMRLRGLQKIESAEGNFFADDSEIAQAVRAAVTVQE